MLLSTFTIETKTVRIVRLDGTIAAITGKAVLSRLETTGASGEVSAMVYIAKDGKRRACSLSWRRRVLKYDEGESQHCKLDQQFENLHDSYSQKSSVNNGIIV
jgi:hypothetical protein